MFKKIWYFIEELIDDKITWGLFKIARKPMYWVRCHVFCRYHIIDISNQGDYRWGWIDSPEKMETACYKILVDFVELEKPFEHIDWDYDEQQKNIAKEFMEIYEWWKRGKKQEDDACSKMFADCGWTWKFDEIEETKDKPNKDKLYEMNTSTRDPQLYKKYEKEYDRLKKKEDEMFERLMKIRKYLWT